VRGSSELTASNRHLHTSLLCTSSSCMVILLPPVVGPVLASALPRRRSLRDRPCQGTAVRDLVALHVCRSRAATPHLRPRTSEPRASMARIALLLSRLKPPCTSLLAPGRSPPLKSCSCIHMLMPPASVPRLLRPPNTCTHCQLLRDTARTLARPARRRLRLLLHCPRTAPAPTSLHHTRTPPACWARVRLLLGRAPSPSCAPVRLHSPARTRSLPCAEPRAAATRFCALRACSHAPAPASTRATPHPHSA
jgi:hypothetical protein